MKRNTYTVKVGEVGGKTQVVQSFEIPEASCVEEASDVIEQAMMRRGDMLQAGNVEKRLENIVDRIERVDNHLAYLHRKTQDAQGKTIEAVKEAVKAALGIDESKAVTLEECVAEALIDDDVLADKIAARVGDMVAKLIEKQQHVTFIAPKFGINTTPAEVAQEMISGAKIRACDIAGDDIRAVKIETSGIKASRLAASSTSERVGGVLIQFDARGKIYDQMRRLEALAAAIAENKDGDTASEILHRQEKIAQAMIACAVALK